MREVRYRVNVNDPQIKALFDQANWPASGLQPWSRGKTQFIFGLLPFTAVCAWVFGTVHFGGIGAWLMVIPLVAAATCFFLACFTITTHYRQRARRFRRKLPGLLKSGVVTQTHYAYSWRKFDWVELDEKG